LIVCMFVWLVLVDMSKIGKLSAQVEQLRAQVRTQASSLEAMLRSGQPALPPTAGTTPPEAMAPPTPQPVAAPPRHLLSLRPALPSPNRL
jgi:hypothetical protein